MTGTQQLICSSFDEIKIQETLVFEKYTDKLVGFVDLGDNELNEITFKNKIAGSGDMQRAVKLKYTQHQLHSFNALG